MGNPPVDLRGEMISWGLTHVRGDAQVGLLGIHQLPQVLAALVRGQLCPSRVVAAQVAFESKVRTRGSSQFKVKRWNQAQSPQGHSCTA
jgi:hypothetical protein